MRKIKLTRGKFAIVINRHFAELNKHKWHAREGKPGWFYAARAVPGNNGKMILMHRLIVGAVPGSQVDHKNLNTLDNRPRNLRKCTGAQNQHNRRAYKNNTSGFKGVSWNKYNRAWIAGIRIHSHRIHLGYFETAKEAGIVYARAAKKYHGEFARTI